MIYIVIIIIRSGGLFSSVSLGRGFENVEKKIQVKAFERTPWSRCGPPKTRRIRCVSAEELYYDRIIYIYALLLYRGSDQLGLSRTGHVAPGPIRR